ncbi:hypothetical protein NDU88_002453 [Pleurodeles waltl]|uniref:Uncharacterized protein n=1 Tax=Pleurodeles waltl TaxID=8319 RepID=A0AAV7KVQ9_PLEWA|nr:hypothetical protein NDU88_002453 [Pleurodeles waltl]
MLLIEESPIDATAATTLCRSSCASSAVGGPGPTVGRPGGIEDTSSSSASGMIHLGPAQAYTPAKTMLPVEWQGIPLLSCLPRIDRPYQEVKSHPSGSRGAPGPRHLTYPSARPPITTDDSRPDRWAFHNDSSQSPALPVAVGDPFRLIATLHLSSPVLALMYMLLWIVKSGLRSYLCVFRRSRPCLCPSCQARSLHKPPGDRRRAALRQDTSRL